MKLIIQSKWSGIVINTIILILLTWYAFNYSFYRQDPLAVFVMQSRLLLDGISINYIDQPGIWMNYLSIPTLYFYQILKSGSGGLPGYFEANQWLYLFNIFILLLSFFCLSKSILAKPLIQIIAALVVLNPLIICTMGSADGYAYALSILSVACLKLDALPLKNIFAIALLAFAATAKSIYLVVYFIPLMVLFNFNLGFQKSARKMLESILIYMGLLGLIVLLFNFPISEHIAFLRNPKITNFESIQLIGAFKKIFNGLANYPEIYLPFICAVYSSFIKFKTVDYKLIITLAAIFMLSVVMLIIVSARPYKAHTYLLAMIPIYLAYIKLLYSKNYDGSIKSYDGTWIQVAMIFLLIYLQSSQYEILKNERDFERGKLQNLNVIIKPYSSFEEFQESEKGNKNYLSFQSSYQIADDYSRNLYSKELALESFTYFKYRYIFSK